MAVEYGLITGFDDGSFRPEATITREQAMVLTVKALRLSGDVSQVDASQAQEILAWFSDRSEIGGWAVDSIALLVERGLVSGYSENRLEPKAFITRAETAVIVERLLQQADLIE